MKNSKPLNEGGRVWISSKIPFIFKEAKGITLLNFIKSKVKAKMPI